MWGRYGPLDPVKPWRPLLGGLLRAGVSAGVTWVSFQPVARPWGPYLIAFIGGWVTCTMCRVMQEQRAARIELERSMAELRERGILR